jgi:ATP-dependent RNA helicase DeaD
VVFNVGHARFVTPVDLVGKIAGITRLPGSAIGAIDILETETPVDVAEDSVELILAPLVWTDAPALRSPASSRD